ncbi:MAG: PAAR domain-containing protein [Pseudomonadota bacterium]
MRNVIRLGDPTSHGGKVISTRAVHFRVEGIPVACVGDVCSCPVPGHGNCTIASGSEIHRINGIRLAFEDDVTSCGAKLIPTLSNFHRT